MLVIAHRGASAYCIENTIPAFELAVELGADMIETDLHPTRDGDVVLVHDADLRRFGGPGAVSDASLDALKALDLGDGQRIPSLGEFLAGFAGRIAMNLELKRNPKRDYTGLVERSVAAVEKAGGFEDVLFSSFSDTLLRELRARAPQARIAVLASRGSDAQNLERARSVGAEAINPHDSMATAQWVEAAHAAEFRVNVYTVDDPARMQALRDLGVDGIFTNCPDRLRKILEPGIS